MSFSRRDFFLKILPKGESASSELPKSFDLGPLATFPVHSATEIKLQREDFIVQSQSEGLKLIHKNSGKSFCLQLGSNGHLIADIGQNWPDNAVLSVFSGEIYYI